MILRWKPMKEIGKNMKPSTLKPVNNNRFTIRIILNKDIALNLIKKIEKENVIANNGSFYETVQSMEKYCLVKLSIRNQFTTFWSNMFVNFFLQVMETFIRKAKCNILKRLHKGLKHFRFGSELTTKRSKINVYESGISYLGIAYEAVKKTEWNDRVRAIYCIVKYGLVKA